MGNEKTCGRKDFAEIDFLFNTIQQLSAELSNWNIGGTRSFNLRDFQRFLSRIHYPWNYQYKRYLCNLKLVRPTHFLAISALHIKFRKLHGKLFHSTGIQENSNLSEDKKDTAKFVKTAQTDINPEQFRWNLQLTSWKMLFQKLLIYALLVQSSFVSKFKIKFIHVFSFNTNIAG